jgi:hypothetical protein
VARGEIMCGAGKSRVGDARELAGPSMVRVLFGVCDAYRGPPASRSRARSARDARASHHARLYVRYSEDIKMEIETLNPDCEIEQLFFHMKVNGVMTNSNHSRILLWLEKKGPGDYSVADIAEAIGLSIRQTRLSINLVCCTINATKLKLKYNILVSGKTKSAIAHFARV